MASALPLTSDNLYSEIQKDLLRPVLISSLMAGDTFLHTWVNDGERDADQMTQYLREIKRRYGTVTAFFISDRTKTYYQADGVLKKVDAADTRDAWYFRVSKMTAPYEINVDPDAANKDALTIFINYRVMDPGDVYLGVAGVGLTVDAVRKLVETYQQRYQRTVYFVDASGRVSLFARGGDLEGRNIGELPGLKGIASEILAQRGGTFRYLRDGHAQLLNVRFIPELGWYLFVEQDEHDALTGARRTLYLAVAVSLLITGLVLLLTTLTITRYQRRVEELATTDKLTGLANRQAFDLLVPHALREAARNKTNAVAVLIDIDNFKSVNDRFGHAVGDAVIVQVGQLIQQSIRASDFVFRWGGEEYLVIAKTASEEEGVALAEKIRRTIGTKRMEIERISHTVTVSAGVATYRDNETMDDWIKRADAGLYASKNEGRNSVSAA